MNKRVRLTVISGPHAGRKYCFRDGVDCLAGRADDCFVSLAGEERDRLISRHHCHLEMEEACVRVEDLNSANGTFLNGQEIDRATLRDGDLLNIGGTTIQVNVLHCPFEEAVWKEGDLAKRGCRMPCT